MADAKEGMARAVAEVVAIGDGNAVIPPETAQTRKQLCRDGLQDGFLVGL